MILKSIYIILIAVSGVIATLFPIRNSSTERLTIYGVIYMIFFTVGLCLALITEFYTDIESKKDRVTLNKTSETVDTIYDSAKNTEKHAELTYGIVSEWDVTNEQWDNTFNEDYHSNIIPIDTPLIIFEIQELKNNTIRLKISADKNNKTKIDKLFFTIELPGTFSSFSDEYKTKIGNINFTKKFSMSISDSTVQEIIQVEITDLYPSSYFSKNIKYNSYSRFSYKFEDFIDCYDQTFDLFDFLIYSYYWTEDGKTHECKSYIDLSNLKYIIKDNEIFKLNKSVIKNSIKDHIINHPTDNLSKLLVKNKLNSNDTLVINVNNFESSKYYIVITNDTIYRHTEDKMFGDFNTRERELNRLKGRL